METVNKRSSAYYKSHNRCVRPAKSATPETSDKRKNRVAKTRSNQLETSNRGNRQAAALSKKSTRKTSRTPTGKSNKKTSRKTRQNGIALLMKGFKDARPSDVSDKVFVANSPVHGKGLFAARKIKANTVLGRLHGMPTFDDGDYVLWITDELGLELTNDFKYINHDSNPNAAYSDIDVMALRDIEPGEELLHDYGW
jgi:SET domain-containing protein